MPLPAVRRFYRLVTPLDPRWRRLRPFAADVLGLEERAAGAWARDLWAGAALGREVHRRVARDDVREIEAMLLPVDWSPIDHAMAGGRGVLLAGAHVGPGGVATWAAARRYGEVMALLRALPDVARMPHVTLVNVEDPDVRAQSLVMARQRLREGGLVYLVADGGVSNERVERRVLGRTVSVSRGAATLARLSRVMTVPIAALWVGDRIRIELGTPIPPGDDDAWLARYLTWIEPILRGPAANYRIGSGILWKSRR